MDGKRLGRLLLFGPLAGWGWRGAVIAAGLAWLPALLFAAGLSLAGLTGCPVNEAQVQPCRVAGIDIGGLLYGLTMMGWIVIALLPVMLLTLLAGLVGGAVALWRARRQS
ncbi:hypothetical protein [Methylobacterium oryzisoli]|uniref:hypothetical protein n=1 Tax=Methylobacterium oryzisoli TaxID=3385502 RepID=UPI0038918FC9